MTYKVIDISLEEFERGSLGRPRPMMSRSRPMDVVRTRRWRVLAWWADVGMEIEAEEATAQSGQSGELDS